MRVYLFFTCMFSFFDLPLGIIRDKVPVETDLGTLGTAPVFSEELLGLRVLF